MANILATDINDKQTTLTNYSTSKSTTINTLSAVSAGNDIAVSNYTQIATAINSLESAWSNNCCESNHCQSCQSDKNQSCQNTCTNCTSKDQSCQDACTNCTSTNQSCQNSCTNCTSKDQSCQSSTNQSNQGCQNSCTNQSCQNSCTCQECQSGLTRDSYTKSLLHCNALITDEIGTLTWAKAVSVAGNTVTAKFNTATADTACNIICQKITLGGSSFTIDFWYKFSASSAWGGLYISKLGVTMSQGQNGLIGLEHNNANARVGVYYAAGQGTVQYFDIAHDSYNHYAFVYDHSAKTFKAYYNGTLKVSKSVTINSTDYQISISNNSYTKIDELRISNTTRWTTDFSIPTAKYSNDSNTLLLFRTGNDTLNNYQFNAYTSDTSNLSLTTGKFGNAINLPTNYYIGSTWANTESGKYAGLQLGGDPFTVDWWMKYTSSTSCWTGLFFWEMGQSLYHGRGELIGIETYNGNTSSNQLSFYCGKGESTSVSASSVTLTNWNHYAIIYNSGTLKLYVNGTLKSTVSVTLTRKYRQFMINHNTLIDEFRVSDGIARWTANFTPRSQPYE